MSKKELKQPGDPTLVIRSLLDENGKLRPEVQEEIDRRHKESMDSPGMKKLMKRICDSRRFTAEDMNFTINKRDTD